MDDPGNEWASSFGKKKRPWGEGRVPWRTVMGSVAGVVLLGFLVSWTIRGPEPLPRAVPTPAPGTSANADQTETAESGPGAIPTPPLAPPSDPIVKLVRIEPGEFLVTRYKTEDGENPPHKVQITRAFSLGATEVTQKQYQEVMGVNPSHFKGSDDLPVENVSWFDAAAFCNKLSERENRRPCYRIHDETVTFSESNGYRLPTEAEWEYACRAGSVSEGPFGAKESGLGEYAWFEKNSGGETHPVGQKQPNAWGLYDMLGNVWEWCHDGSDIGYSQKSLPVELPGGPIGDSRVYRGGGWYCGPEYCNPSYRYAFTPVIRYDSLGFRVATVQDP